MILLLLYCSFSKVCHSQRFQQLLNLVSSSLFCANCDLRHHLFPSEYIKANHRKIYMCLITPILLINASKKMIKCNTLKNFSITTLFISSFSMFLSFDYQCPCQCFMKTTQKKQR